jgi:hypothetical protein
MFASKHGEAIRRLYGGDASAYDGDDSRADSALACHFAFWAGNDAARMERLMSGSALGQRDKWKNRQDYRDRTIQNAIRMTPEVYKGGAGGVPSHPPSNGSHTPELAQAAPVEWEEPIPFNEYKVPSFPTNVFPEAIRKWVEAEAFGTETPVDLASIVVLGVLSTACAKKVVVKVSDDWIEPVNLYSAVVLPTGCLKSVVFKQARKPIYDYELSRSKMDKEDYQRRLTEYRIAEGQLQEAEKQAAKATTESDPNGEAKQRAMQLAKDFARLEKPVLPRLTVDDITIEKLVSHMAEQKGRISLYDPEGGFFSVLAGKYSEGKTNFNAVLKAWSGEQIIVDRQSRESQIIESPSLTIILSPQPAVFTELENKELFHERGMFARFIFSYPESPLGKRSCEAMPVPYLVREAYDTKVRSILTLKDTVDQNGELAPVPLLLSEVGHAMLIDFRKENEPRIGADGDLAYLSGFMSKLPGMCLRMAALLHMAKHVNSDSRMDLVPTTIEDDTLSDAFEIGHYLITHTQAIYGAMEADPSMKAGLKLIRWIQKEKRERFSRREAFREVQTYAKDVDALKRVLKLLIDHQWIMEDGAQEPAQRDRGRPAGPFYLVNPHALEERGRS